MKSIDEIAIELFQAHMIIAFYRSQEQANRFGHQGVA
jgi:hypothetical protein